MKIKMTVYQRNLMGAYMVGIATQVFTLYVLSQIYCDELEFVTHYALMYVVCAALYFFLFLTIFQDL